MPDQYLIDMQTSGLEEIDWGVLSIPGVDEAVVLCAQRLASRFDNIADEDDLTQEGRIWAAENPSLVRSYVAENHFGQLRNRITSRMTNLLRSQFVESERVIGLHRFYEMAD